MTLTLIFAAMLFICVDIPGKDVVWRVLFNLGCKHQKKINRNLSDISSCFRCKMIHPRCLRAKKNWDWTWLQYIWLRFAILILHCLHGYILNILEYLLIEIPKHFLNYWNIMSAAARGERNCFPKLSCMFNVCLFGYFPDVVTSYHRSKM